MLLESTPCPRVCHRPVVVVSVASVWQIRYNVACGSCILLSLRRLTGSKAPCTCVLRTRWHTPRLRWRRWPTGTGWRDRLIWNYGYGCFIQHGGCGVGLVLYIICFMFGTHIVLIWTSFCISITCNMFYKVSVYCNDLFLFHFSFCLPLACFSLPFMFLFTASLKAINCGVNIHHLVAVDIGKTLWTFLFVV